MRVGLTYNLKKEVGESEGLPEDFYAEWGDPVTVESVRDAILERHEEVVMIEADEGAYEKLRSSRPEMVFNMAEGLRGESRESQLPAIMDMLGIPYTGSAPLTLGLCLNKARTKELLSSYNIPTSRFAVIEDGDVDLDRCLGFPMIVKPLFEGSSKGIRNDSVVHDSRQLREKVLSVRQTYRQPVLVEEYLAGREFTIAVLGNGPAMEALPIVEIDYSALPEGVTHIYSYEARWMLDGPENPLDIFACPAPVNERLKVGLEKAALDACRVMDIKDWCRVDIRCNSVGAPHVLELNPLPGILMDPRRNSCFPRAARAAGMTFTDLVNRVIDLAAERYGL
ncbi:MAG: ATP-grasp domain-containing protein [Thermodesulfobacteriota bacterium]|nr:MAG: ATP-grasp domain-containing protein [Thermodesulfobacteriota bacterium]